MNYKFHVTVGVAASVGISAFIMSKGGYISYWEPITFCGAAAFGSLLPDVDIPDSKLSRRFPGLSAQICNYFFTMFSYWRDPSYAYDLSLHRGITHSFTACLVSIFPILSLGIMGFPTLQPCLGVMLGMLLHIIADSFTPMGCMLLAPFSTKRYFLVYQKRYRCTSHYTKTAPIKRLYFALLYLCNLVVCFIKSFYLTAIVTALFVLIMIVSKSLDDVMLLSAIIIGIALIVAIGMHVLLCFVRNKLMGKLYERAKRCPSKKEPEAISCDASTDADLIVDAPASNVISFSALKAQHEDKP